MKRFLADDGSPVVYERRSATTSGILFSSPGRAPLRLSPSAYHLLAQRRAGASFERLARQANGSGKTVTPDEVKTAYHHLERRIAACAAQRTRLTLPPGFWWRRPLFSRQTVGRGARFLAPLFHPAALIAGGLVAAALIAGALNRPAIGAAPADWLFATLLLIAALLFHELGHATACARFGAAPEDIGIAVYLVYPVFYTDVTSAWQLERGQRVLVDVGGVFFQLLAGGICAGLYLLTDQGFLRLALLLNLASALFSLNPIFRLDGYWLLADALGIDDLGRWPARLRERLRGHPTTRAGTWTRRQVLGACAYSLLCIVAWLWLLSHFLPWAWRQWAELPAHLEALRAGGDFQALQGDAFGVIGAIWVLVVGSLLARRAWRARHLFGMSS